MTRTKRILNVAGGIILILFAAALVLAPRPGISLVAGIFGIGLTLRGIGGLVYYFRMARWMVGGKSALYRSIFYLDAGLFAGTLAGIRSEYVIIYIAGVNLFAGAVAILRSRETKQVGSRRWVLTAAYGVLMIATAAAALVSEIVWRNTDVAVYIYAAGLVSSGVRMIGRAFRRTAIAYIP